MKANKSIDKTPVEITDENGVILNIVHYTSKPRGVEIEVIDENGKILGYKNEVNEKRKNSKY